MEITLRAKVIGSHGRDSLAVEWINDSPQDGSVKIDGPAVNQLSKSLVPKSHQLPNSLLLVSLKGRYTVIKVETL